MAPGSRPFILFLAATAGSFAVLLVAAFGLFLLQLGTKTSETVGRCSGVEAKLRRAAAISSPKMLFIGGSAVHKGINAEMAGQALGVPAANLGTFAALGPGVILWNARKVLRRGDTAVLVFEYDLFWHNRPTGPEIDYVMGCGGNYLRALPLSRQMQYALGADPFRMLRARRKSGANAVGRELGRLTPTGDARFIPLNFKPVGAAQAERMKLYRPISIRFDHDSRDVKEITGFVLWAKAHGIRVIAAWPNMLYFPAYERDEGFARVEAFYRSLGVPMAGKPTEAMFPLSHLHDTQYHLNEKGIIERTGITIRNLKPFFGGGSPDRP